jgi:predicted dehydrogenase
MKNLSRRSFINAGAAAAAVTIVPRHVLGRGFVAPSDKLNIAGIGIGGMGASDLNSLQSENIVALCDVDWKYAAKIFARYPNAKAYRDFRVMLEKEKDIDAVTVATPDHNHAVVAMTAMKAGKHVYVQKPLTYSIGESLRLLEESRKSKVATMMGNQGHAMEEMRLLKEWINDGAIGAVREVHAWTPHPVWPQGLDRPTDTPPVPETLSWDLWLGPAPERPYNPAYLPGVWRGRWDFGTGGLGDMGCHIFDHIVYSLDLGYPTSVEARGSIFVAESMNWNKKLNTESYPQATIVYYHFPARGQHPPLKLVWYDGGLQPEHPEELEPGRKMGDTYGGAFYIGDKGIIMTGSHGARGVRIIPEAKMAAYQRPPKTLPRSIGHYEEWIRACKGGEPGGTNFEYAVPLTITVLMGNVALRHMEKLHWDADAMQFKEATANEYLMRAYRQGWNL